MNKLKELRTQTHLSQSTVSKAINIPQSTYNCYETGKVSPTIEPLIKLANFYNVSLDYLVDRKFANEIGFLTKEQYEAITSLLLLSESDQKQVFGYISALGDKNKKL